MKNPITLLKDVATRLAAGKAAAQDLHAAEADLRAAHAALLAERAQLIGALPPRQALVRAAAEEVDAHAAQFRAGRALEVARAVAGGLEVGADGMVRGVRAGSIAGGLSFPLDFATLCALAPDAVKAGLRAILEAADYQAGPPLADRAALIAAVDERIRETIEQHTALVDDAKALGIPLQLMPEEHARRLRAERHRADADAFNSLNRDAIKRGAVKTMQ